MPDRTDHAQRPEAGQGTAAANGSADCPDWWPEGRDVTSMNRSWQNGDGCGNGSMPVQGSEGGIRAGLRGVRWR